MLLREHGCGCYDRSIIFKKWAPVLGADFLQVLVCCCLWVVEIFVTCLRVLEFCCLRALFMAMVLFTGDAYGGGFNCECF